MNDISNKKINLILRDLLINQYGDFEINAIYLSIYEELEESLQRVFALFHEKLNNSFDFMNKKSNVNNHYNADGSRELIQTIDNLREIKKGLQNTTYDFDINNSYVEQIKFVQTFLENSGGSPIPEDYKKFNIIKYEPIFILKNTDAQPISLDVSFITSETNFDIDKITIKINKNIFSHIESLLKTEHYYNAIEESYKIVRKKLKDITGKEKAHEAFNKDNFNLIFHKEAEDEAEEDFFEGVKFLHMAIQKLRNEKAHDPAKKIDKNLAMHYIVLAGLAYDLIDR